MVLAELRQDIETQIREGQLPEALQALLSALPAGSEMYRIVSALIARLNAANKERYRNTISFDEYQRRIDQVSADFFDLLAGLKEADFENKPASAKAAAGKQGSVLYHVPQLMRIQKPTRCTIRVAVSEDEILENIVLDKFLKVKSQVEISDVMSAELLDPEGGIFQISALNARTQLVRDTGYTEWNFNVTPLADGVHQLLVKVSIMEVVPGFAEPIPREVSLMETVTIVTEAIAPSESQTIEFKPSGQTFAFQSDAAPGMDWGAEISKSVEEAPQSYPSQGFELPPAPASSEPIRPSSGRSLRPLALFLAFLVLIPAATWAIAPDLPAYVSAIIQDTPEAYAHFIEQHPDSPRIEKAYFYRAETSGRLADLRAYQQKYQQKGRYAAKVDERITLLERAAIVSIQERPDSLKIHNFVNDFPESDRLAEIKQAVEARADKRQELMSQVESAYVRSVKVQPTETKVSAYLRDFPKTDRLNEVDAAARTNPEVFQKVKPLLEEAYLKKMEQNPTPKQADEYLEKFPEPAQKDRFEKILDKKPAIRKELRQKWKAAQEAKGG